MGLGHRSRLGDWERREQRCQTVRTLLRGLDRIALQFPRPGLSLRCRQALEPWRRCLFKDDSECSADMIDEISVPVVI